MKEGNKMSKVGLIFAMEEEVSSLKKYINIENEYNIFDLVFYETTINNNKCILALSGVGKVNSARCTQILIDNMKVDYIINVGVAGSLTKELDICDIVLGEKLVQHDFDITAFNHKKGYIPNVGVYIESDNYLLTIANEVGRENNLPIKRGVIASGDIFCTDSNMGSKINEKFNALCTEMEGASIAQVCYLSHIPFLIIRSISDSLNKNNNLMTYEEFLEKASDIVSLYLMEILKKL